MKWSKLKKTAESLLADSLRDRVQYHVTRYGGPHLSQDMTRAWITFDKEELADFSTMKWLYNYYRLAHEIREVNHCQDYLDESQKEGYYASYQQADTIMDQQGIYSRQGFIEALEVYLQMSIEEAISSDNTIIRAISMLDRRVGKRRLRQIEFSETEHPLVKRFYELRCDVEDIRAS
jgi:hypothetical protein